MDDNTQDFTSFIPKSPEGFVETPYIQQITAQALDYIKIGTPVHFRGAAGVGKTTLAMHVASQLSRPATILYGDFDLTSPDFVGSLQGYQKRRVVDNYIRTVLKTEESTRSHWIQGLLFEACKNGYTFIYDEFTRSRPETNNIFLSVLEERILPLPLPAGYGGYLKVHPDFVCIFTSNPRDYAGIQKTPDALLDRMVTIDLGNFDAATEIEICRARSGVSADDAGRIVRVVREVRTVKSDHYLPSIRSSVLIAKLLNLKGAHASAGDPVFERICLNVVLPQVPDCEKGAVEDLIRQMLDGFREGGECGAEGG